MTGSNAPDLSKAGSRQPRCVTRLPLLLNGDVVDDLRFRLRLPNDLFDLFLRQLRLGEADAVELASHGTINHLGLVGTKKVGDVIRGRLGGKAHDRIGAFARRAGEPGFARTALLFNHYCGNHGRLHQDRNGGGVCRPGKRARSKAREKLRDAAAEVEPAPVARRPRLLGIDGGEQSLQHARRWHTDCLIQVDRLDKLLADQVILPRQFAVAGQRLLHAIGVAGAQRPGRVVALSRHMVDTLPAGSDVAFDHAPGSLFLRTRRGAACDAQRNNDRSNEASHPNLSRGLRQGRWRPAALTRNGSCRWRITKFRRAAGSFPFLVALAPEPGLVALRQRFALSRLSPYPQMVLPANPGPSAVRNDAMANAVADGP